MTHNSFVMAFQVSRFEMIERSLTDKTHRFTSVISECKLFLPFCVESSLFLFILSSFALFLSDIFFSTPHLLLELAGNTPGVERDLRSGN